MWSYCFKRKRVFAVIDSVVVSNGTYYLGSSYDNKYLVCKKWVYGGYLVS